MRSTTSPVDAMRSTLDEVFPGRFFENHNSLTIDRNRQILQAIWPIGWPILRSGPSWLSPSAAEPLGVTQRLSHLHSPRWQTSYLTRLSIRIEAPMNSWPV